MRAIETTGTIDESGQLRLHGPLSFEDRGPVRVILLFEEDDISERDWLSTASRNRAFDFLDDPAEDIYSPEDGQPFHQSDELP